MQQSRVVVRVIESLEGFGSFAGDRPARAEGKVQVGWAERVGIGLAFRVSGLGYWVEP